MTYKISGMAICLLLITGFAANAGDRDAFYGMCHATSLGDGMDDGAASSFCNCLTDAASEDDDLYAELFAAGTKEPDLDARMALLSQGAHLAAQSCQG